MGVSMASAPREVMCRTTNLTTRQANDEELAALVCGHWSIEKVKVPFGESELVTVSTFAWPAGLASRGEPFIEC